MTAPLLRNFDRFEDADRARDQLLKAGLPADCVQLQVIQDEAGPVEGNFVSGNGRTAFGHMPSEGIMAGADVPYDQNFAKTVARGVHLLTVDTDDETQCQRARAILDALGSVDVHAARAAGTGA